LSAIRFVLWDHLSLEVSSLSGIEKNDLVLFAELLEEANYLNHHKKKLAFLFSAQRHFSEELKDKHSKIKYLDLSKGIQNFKEALQEAKIATGFHKVIITEPGEFRILEAIEKACKELKLHLEIKPDDRFFFSQNEFKEWSLGKKKLLLENFYRLLRKKTGYLMDENGEPEEGRWNFDSENRKGIVEGLKTTDPLKFKVDEITEKVIKDIEHYFPHHFGDLEPFCFATTRNEAKKALSFFIKHSLKDFGTYQDAMDANNAFLNHSVISHYINSGLLLPKMVLDEVQKAYYDEKVQIESAEGYIRQILGWREYVRGVYWLKMPKFRELNFLDAKRKLPSFYWTAETDMNCIKNVVLQTKEHAYSHHIQRLMITGNFALLIGVAPKEISDWYLSVYADAHGWVETPNTIGMSQFADGGFLATKPYASSGSYINKMSNFCKNCKYKVSEKEGDSACPFNYLYWDFLIRNKKMLEKNPRLTMPYSTLKKFTHSKIEQVKKDSEKFFKKLESDYETYTFRN
jgi:deoxyribodipyrimidine photolyase-related protein